MSSNKSIKISAHDVAKLAMVSQSTVSRVLNGTRLELFTVATRERVLAAADELGYVPNPMARALRGKQSHLLGVIVREISDPFFSAFISELSFQALQEKYHIVLGHARSDPQEAVEISSVLDTRYVDGLFVLGDLQQDEQALQRIQQNNHSVIALCRGPSPSFLYTINVDNNAGIQMLLDHLVSLGHKKFAFINGGWLGDIRERHDAFCSYLSHHHLPVNLDWIQTDNNSIDGGYKAAQRLLSIPEQPTAVIASDDVMAIGVMTAIVDGGYTVPSDYSVVGFDDLEIAHFLRPELTTIKQPIESMCNQAFNLMIQLINRTDEDLHQSVLRLTPELMVRSSSGPPPVHR